MKPGIVAYNGIEIPEKVSTFDRIVPGYTRGNPTYEGAEVEAIRTHSKRGDKVTIVGAGLGITTIAAANSVGDDGQVLAYEASTDRFSRAKAAVEYNQLGDIIKLYHAVVAKSESIVGEAGSADKLSPKDLQSCDFLELDCEGAEKLILEEMTISPKAISVETHKNQGVSHTNVLGLLEERGYQIESITDTDQFEGTRHIVAILEE